MTSETLPATGHLRERARAALKEREAWNAEAAARADAESAAKLAKKLGAMGIEGGEVHGRMVVVDGIAFSLEAYGQVRIHLPCLGCGRRVRVECSVESLADVGETVGTIEGADDFFCSRCNTGGALAPTTADQLLSLIRDLIREEVGSRE